MKKIMILGASILQLPAILKAKEMGLFVIAVDIDEFAVGFKHADIKLKISTLDIPSVLESAKKYRIDGIITLASDMPMRTVAVVAKELNLIGISLDTAYKATNKVLMRNCLKENNIPIPEYYKVQSEEEYNMAVLKLDSECIVKPSDNSGSKGIFLLKNTDEENTVKNAYKYSMKYSRSGEIIIEEYMKGREVSVETLSVDSKVHIIAITDKVTTGSPYFVEMGHSEPSQLSDIIKNRIKNITILAVKSLGIDNGPAHTEIIITNEGPKIVEIGARLGGDNITSHLVPLSTGIDIIKSSIEISLGQTPKLCKKDKKGAAIRYFETFSGKLKEINGVDKALKLKGIKQITFTKELGYECEKIQSSQDRIGFIITQSDNVEEAIEQCNKALDLIEIKIE